MRRYAYDGSMKRAHILGWVGRLAGWLFRSFWLESALTWPGLTCATLHPTLTYLPTYLSICPPPPSSYLPASPRSPFPFSRDAPFPQRSVARLYPSGKPTLFTYLRSVERGAMFLLAHPFSALRHPVSPAIPFPPCSACLTMLL